MGFKQREQVDRRFGALKKGPVLKQGGLEMKKFVIAMALFVVMMSAQIAQAAAYRCTVNSTSNAAVYLTHTASTPAFTNRAFTLPTNATVKNQYMAVILTAIASGKEVLISVPSTTALTTLQGLLIYN